jgi:hypothetical protein
MILITGRAVFINSQILSQNRFKGVFKALLKLKPGMRSRRLLDQEPEGGSHRQVIDLQRVRPR